MLNTLHCNCQGIKAPQISALAVLNFIATRAVIVVDNLVMFPQGYYWASEVSLLRLGKVPQRGTDTGRWYSDIDEGTIKDTKP
jgi:hypothetical protein